MAGRAATRRCPSGSWDPTRPCSTPPRRSGVSSPASAVPTRPRCGSMPAMAGDLLEALEVETAPSPRAAVIWMHGLGADGHDFVDLVPALGLEGTPVRFVFPHAPRGRGRRARVAGAHRGADRA